MKDLFDTCYFQHNIVARFLNVTITEMLFELNF